MDTTDPEITFDANDVCNQFREFDRMTLQLVFSGEEGWRRLDEIVARIQHDEAVRRYDCETGVSGGVNCTSVAYKVKQLGLCPLAVHLDNDWEWETTVGNISVALSNAGY